MLNASKIKEAESILDGFVEAMFKVIFEHHHRRVVALELTLPQAQTLRILWREPLSTSRLAAELRISAPAVSQLTDRLVRKSLIDRRPVEGDRRMVLLSLTGRGRDLVNEFRRHRNEVFSNAFSHLGQGDRDEILAALKTISSALGAEEVGLQSTASVQDARRPPKIAAEASNITAGAKPVPNRLRMEWD